MGDKLHQFNLGNLDGYQDLKENGDVGLRDNLNVKGLINEAVMQLAFNLSNLEPGESLDRDDLLLRSASHRNVTAFIKKEMREDYLKIYIESLLSVLREIFDWLNQTGDLVAGCIFTTQLRAPILTVYITEFDDTRLSAHTLPY